MRISTLFFLIGRGMRNLGHHWAMTVACIGSLTVCLFLNGYAQLVEANIDSLVEYLGRQNETVVWLDPDCSDKDAQNVALQIERIGGVDNIVYVSKQDVLETYRGYMEEYASLWDEFEDDNPFKASYRVTVHSLSDLESLSAQWSSLHGVNKVSAPTEISNVFLTVQRGVKIVERVFVGTLLLVSLITVGSTIRVSVFARREEIQIMKYVGATNFMVAMPFWIEGLMLGLLAGLLSAGIIIGSYALVVEASTYMTGVWKTLFSDSLIPVEKMWSELLNSAVAAGLLIGGVGSLFSIRRHLNV